MATEIVIPRLGMTMSEGTLEEWLVAHGHVVEAGAPLFRVTTDQLDRAVVAPTDGRVHHLVEAGTTLPCGAMIGWLLGPDEAAPADGEQAPTVVRETEIEVIGPRPGSERPTRPVPSDQRLAASPAARALASRLGVDLSTVRGTGPLGRIVVEDIIQAEHTTRAAPSEPPVASAPSEPAGADEPPSAAPASVREIASPIARRVAETLGVDLASVIGTGPEGRITRDDVERAAQRVGPVAAGDPPSPGDEDEVGEPGAGTVRRRVAASSEGFSEFADDDVVPYIGMRRIIGERMRESLGTSAQSTMTVDVRADDLAILREQLLDEWSADDVRPTYTDLVVRAAAKALRHHPVLNAQVNGDRIELPAAVHIGVAMALAPSERVGPLGGLVVATTRHADRLSMRDLALETARLAAAARSGSLAPEERTGATFCVTSLDANGIDMFTPIVHPPNVAMLGIGRIRDGLRWVGDRPTRSKVMTLSLTIDQRVVDGEPGAEFLAAISTLLEQPYRLLV